jgi:hypothetical protein
MAGGSDYREEIGKSGCECACCDSLIIGAKTLEADKVLCPPTHSQPRYSTVVFYVNEYRKSNLGLLSVVLSRKSMKIKKIRTSSYSFF